MFFLILRRGWWTSLWGSAESLWVESSNKLDVFLIWQQWMKSVLHHQAVSEDESNLQQWLEKKAYLYKFCSKKIKIYSISFFCFVCTVFTCRLMEESIVWGCGCSCPIMRRWWMMIGWLPPQSNNLSSCSDLRACSCRILSQPGPDMTLWLTCRSTGTDRVVFTDLDLITHSLQDNQQELDTCFLAGTLQLV